MLTSLSLDAPLRHHRHEIQDRIRAYLRRRGPNVLHIGPLPETGELAQQLCSFAGPPFEFALLATSEGDAFDNALKLARAATRRPRLLACPGPRRARSLGALSLRGVPPALGALLGDCEPVPLDPIAVERALEERPVAALVLEPVDDELRPLGPSIFKHMEVLCKQAGALLIVDETLTGLGRCGRRFAFQGAGVEPGAVVVGQGLGAGAMALAATLAAGPVYRKAFGGGETFDLHTATMAGNAAACEAGLGLLDVLEREGLPQRAARLGERLRAGLRAALGEAGQVDGVGLLVGVTRPGRGRVAVAPPLDATKEEIDELVLRLVSS
jgi:acetylornithine/succinyldiaminopimelate/putrescine aminotransferase